MAAADVQVAPGTPGSPNTWPGCGPPVTDRSASPFPLHRSAPASRLPSISSSPRYGSVRPVNVAHLVAKAAPRASTEMMVPPKAASQPALVNAEQSKASQRTSAVHAAANAAGSSAPTSGTPAMPVQSTSTVTQTATATPAESLSEGLAWPEVEGGSLDDELDSAMFDFTHPTKFTSLGDNYSLPEFPGQHAAASHGDGTGTGAGAGGVAAAQVTAENSLEHIFDSMGLDDGAGMAGTRVSAQGTSAAHASAFAHADHSVPPAAAPMPSTSGQSHTETQPHVLVRLDDRGNILRQATPDDIALLTQLLSDEAPAAPAAHTVSASTSKASTVPRRSGGVQKRSGPSGGTRKPGGPCNHCGVRGMLQMITFFPCAACVCLGADMPRASGVVLSEWL